MIETLTTDRGHSFRFQLHGSEELQTISAAEIDPQTHTPVPAVEHYRIQDRPLLWFTPEHRSVVVDQRHWSDLNLVDATRVKQDAKVPIGRILDPAALPPRDVVKFLLEGQIIATYWHIGATIQLVEERDDGSSYLASFHAVHEYYTNQRNEDEYEFRVSIDKKTGEITLLGL